ncbi:hypothetical protein GD1_118 [Paraglaciecola Antarctic GD virus 1]|nr:hypothetical protein GD1_118 [Paraglaciecola Antarctic GD virus 1]
MSNKLDEQDVEVENNAKIAEAFDVLKQAMIDDNPSEGGSYAHSWHCNIAMAMFDCFPKDHNCEQALNICNAGATEFMKRCFDVDTKR